MTADALHTAPTADPERAGVGRSIVVAALALGMYMAALDSSIVNAVLPVIADSFRADLSAIEWAVTAYLLVQAALLLAFGRLGDIWGHKQVYLSGLAIFVASSALCAAASSTPFLVASRAVQAVGASMIVANLAAILTSIYPPEQRGKAIGIQATIVYLGLATGAPLGGWLTSVLGWRSVFLVNVPLGIVALLVGWWLTPRSAPAGRRERFDFAGAAIFVVGLLLLLLGLNQGHAWGWTSAPVLGSVLLGLALLATWVVVELRVSSPMLDLRLFEQRAFSAPVASAVLSYAATMSTGLLLPFALIQGRGLNPAEVGLILTSQPVVMAITASFSGSLSDRIGSRLPATAGMILQALGLLLLSRLDSSTPLEVVAGMLLVTGLGIGLFTSPNNSAVLGAVPAERRGVANGVMGTARTLGMVLGVGVAGAVYATTLSLLGDAGPDGVLRAADVGMLVACGIALVGAATSATRLAADAARGAPAGRAA